jgi:uncharacterized protein (DUF488 family)
MNALKLKTVYTIGHSTHSIIEFINMLQSFDINIVADIRSLPGSLKFPQFNQNELAESLAVVGIQYQHLTDLGGRRKAKKDSKNMRWDNESFKGYADYMESKTFENAIVNLEHIAKKETTVLMCSEAVWWRCHRAMVSDYLKAKGWHVWHIMGIGKIQEHNYTSPARIVNGQVFYYD